MKRIHNNKIITGVTLAVASAAFAPALTAQNTSAVYISSFTNTLNGPGDADAQTTWSTHNTTDDHAESSDFLTSTLGLAPTEADLAANDSGVLAAATSLYSQALADINGSAAVDGSAADLVEKFALKDNSAADLANYNEALDIYNSNLQILQNTKDLVEVAATDTFATFNLDGTLGTPALITGVDQGGTAADTIAAAIANVQEISDALNYYSYGAGDPAQEDADGNVVESGVSGVPSTDNDAPQGASNLQYVIDTVVDAPTSSLADDADSDGFVDVEEEAAVDAQAQLEAAQALFDYTIMDEGVTTLDAAAVDALEALVGDTTDDNEVTIGGITYAEGDNVTRSEALTLVGNTTGDFQTAVETMYSNYNTFTEVAQREAVAAIQNGAWERASIDQIAQNGLAGIIELNDDGSIEIGSSSFVLDDTTASHTLTTNGAASELVLGGDAPATGATEGVDIRIANNADVDGNLNVDGATTLDATTVDGLFTVNGNSDLNGDLDVQGNSNLQGNLVVAGTTTLNDTLQVNADTDLNGDLDVQGTANLQDTLTVAGATDLNSTLDVQGAANLQDTLTVAGATDLNSTLDVQGAANFQSTTTTAGLARFNGGINADNGAFTVADGSGAVYTQSSIYADGDITTESDLDVWGDANVDGVLSLGDNGFGGVADVAQAINQNASNIAKNASNIAENRRGIAMVAALQHTTVLPGMTNALDVAAAHFDGETGMSLNYARRINENWQINFGAASTTDFDESVIKAGVGVQW